MKNLLISLFLITNIYAKIVDLGINGQTYEIKEEDFMVMINREIKNLNIDQKELETKAKIEINKQAIGTTNLPYTKKAEKYTTLNYQIIPEDIYNPLGRLYKKAGEKVLINTKVPLDICFIDGKNIKMMVNQIEFFDEIVKRKSGDKAECIYMVSNRNVLELNRRYFPRMFYPSRKIYEDRFMVKSIPTYVHIFKTTKEVHSVPIDMFRHKVKIK